MRTVMLALAVTAATLLGACGSGASVSSTTSPAATPNATSTADAVTIKGFAFNPPAVTVKVGQTVTFTNQDSQPHTATADGGSFDAGSIAPGASASHRFDTPGQFAYHCSFHPFMTGTITVTG